MLCSQICQIIQMMAYMQQRFYNNIVYHRHQGTTMPTTSQLPILILQSVNIIITIAFFVLFLHRYMRIRTMSITNKYLDINWRIRLIIAASYISLSAAMLTLNIILILNTGKDKSQQAQPQWLMNLIQTGSLGFCINSIILIIHIAVLNKQLKRQLPPYIIHQIFIIYLCVISCLRLGISIYQIETIDNNKDNHMEYENIIFILAASLVFVSLVNIVYWIRSKRVLPTFQNYSNVDINTITERITNPILNDHNSIHINSDKYSCVDRWNLVFPNVTVELGKVRIILEMFTDDQVLRSLTQEDTKTYDYHQHHNKTDKIETIDKIQYRISNSKSNSNSNSNTNPNDNYKSLTSNMKNKQHLQIISDHRYTFQQIQNIYLICARFHIQSKLSFENISVADFYRQVKKYMQELWTIKQAYVPEIFQLFGIDRDSIEELNKKIDKLVKNRDQLLVSHYVDFNSLFLSVEIFKQLWTKDHFIFYIQTITMDHKDKAVCYKRFNDFQQFDNKLQMLVQQQIKSQYKLPSLPKKHVFSWGYSDQQRANQRRKQLQNYCRQTFNDYDIMTKMPRAKQLIFQFLGLKKTFDIIPNTKKAIQFYDGLQIIKGNIYKALISEQYVTFYEFQLYRNGILLRSINKRFRQFIALHKSLQRWMQNSQILYKLIVLPQKHLYKSQSKRHQKLLHYLQSVVSVNDVYKIYAVNKFFNMGHRYDTDGSGFGMSIIKRQPSQSDEESIHGNKQIEKQNCQFSMESDKQRMSLMIQQLGQQ